MPLVRIDSIDDPRLAPYRDLPARARARAVAAESATFVVEGEHLVHRLLASPLRTESILVASRRVESLVDEAVTRDCATFVIPDGLVDTLVGFSFHRGVMACGHRPPNSSLERVAPPGDRTLVVIASGIADPQNLGAILRSAAAFGVDGVIVDERSCDPFSRRSIRVSMGGALAVPIRRSTRLRDDLERLRAECGLTLGGAVVAADAECLEAAECPRRLGLLFGSEADGLDADTRASCDRSWTLPMASGTDSLNVSVAAGIFLWHFTRMRPPPP